MSAFGKILNVRNMYKLIYKTACNVNFKKAF